ncbi:MAG: DUF4124 domain-containing protein [Methylotenera sp.]|jgi:hypothetical protein|nr:DUF4124 domain-containing protein [Methylotenera sp.]HPH09229.1 DUF4124 domain-containing protein [Methylotenera sp.]HPM50167.1 DUF4124 domain-containing protein [Methylotenera sp.]HPV32178.1 DUF4124 domain-containing protein [Methylotenera sp.]HQM87964.1 DUF4124 domain-containing protein [Methylotenera sp.]
MKKYLLIFALMTSVFSVATKAEIYKHVDADGRITYSNIKSKGATRLDIDPDSNVIKNDRPRTNNNRANANNNRTATPSDFPKVDKQTQNNRDSKRQEILQNELEGEKAALAQAKKAYAEGEANPEMVRHADGKTFRNVAKFQEKMKSLQADVDGHENNIKLLEKELESLR